MVENVLAYTHKNYASGCCSVKCNLMTPAKGRILLVTSNRLLRHRYRLHAFLCNATVCCLCRSDVPPRSPFLSETILPPPDPFVTDEDRTSNVTKSFQSEADGQILLLPPPEEFDVNPSHDWPSPPPVANADLSVNYDGEIVLPPPELFDSRGNNGQPNDVAPGVESKSSAAWVETSLTTSTETFNEHRSDAADFPPAPSVGLNGNDSRERLVLGVGDERTVQTATSTATKSVVIPVFDGNSASDRTAASGIGLDESIDCEVSAARERLASDAMDKLDALCRTTFEVTSSSMPPPPPARKLPTFTSIPVQHETAVKTRRRRAVADSWPGGLFFRDSRPGVSVDDAITKRHSADTSTMASMDEPKYAVAEESGDASKLSGRVAVQLLSSPDADNNRIPDRRPHVRHAEDGLVRGMPPTGRIAPEHVTAQRHKSLEPTTVSVDAERASSVTCSSSNRVNVRSEGDLYKVSMSKVDRMLSSSSSSAAVAGSGDRMIYGERMTASSKTAAVRKNLLEQATERRRELQQARLKTESSSGANEQLSLSEMTSELKSNESYLSSEESTTAKSPVEERAIEQLAGEMRRDYESDSAEPPMLMESAAEARNSVEVSKATHRRLRTERSMETIHVTRPPSIVLPSSASTPSLRPLPSGDANTESPVRVFVDGVQVSGSRDRLASKDASPVAPTRSSSSTPILDQRTTTSSKSAEYDVTYSSSEADDVIPPPPDDALLPPPAPMCYPESSLDTSSEMQSGRNTPSTMSVLTLPDSSNFGLSSPGNSSTVTDSGIGTTSSQPPERHFIVVAIDFGTTYSGYAFSFVRDPDAVHMMRRWEGGDPGVVNQKTPTTLLLEPNGKFHSFGYAARDFYHDLDAQEAKRWLYFEKFKMALHYNTVSGL